MSNDPISAYAKNLSPVCAAICELLRAEIISALPNASSKIWHAIPVWFIDGNPVVGYSLTSKNKVNLLFWNGQSFNEPGLKAVGKFKAGQAQFTEISQVNIELMRSWLKKAGVDIWDYKGLRQGNRCDA